MKGKTIGDKIAKIWRGYSFIFVFFIIFAVYALTSSGLTMSASMNILRHSAVIGIISLGMGMICLTGEIACFGKRIFRDCFQYHGQYFPYPIICGFICRFLWRNKRLFGWDCKDAGFYCDFGYHADLPLLCAIFLSEHR